MFRIYIILVALLLQASLLNAQPVINMEQYPLDIELPYKYYGDTFILSPGFSGHYDWDYSNLQQAYEYNYDRENCDVYCDTFPGSTHYEKYVEDNSDFYHIWKDSSVSLNGYRKENNDVFVVNKFGDPQQLLVFPLEFNKTFTDTFFNTIHTNIGSQVFTDVEYGTIDGIVDGYGSIKTPVGTYYNVLRLKRTEKKFRNGQYSELETDEWYQQGIGHPIVQINFSTIAQEDRWYRYTSTLPKNVDGMQDARVLKNAVSIYPNPVRNMFKVTVSRHEQHRITVTNIVGKIVFQETRSVQTPETEISTINWAKGIYLVEVKWENTIAFYQKIVVD